MPIEDHIVGGIWKTRPVDEQPCITLVRWQIMEVENGDRHFVGYNVTDREGRVSSRIVEFDPASGKGVTRSGRVYQLVGRPGVDKDGSYVWGVWSRRNEVIDQRDVSREVYESMVGPKEALD